MPIFKDKVKKIDNGRDRKKMKRINGYSVFIGHNIRSFIHSIVISCLL